MSPAHLLIDTNLLYRLIGTDGTSDFLKQFYFSAKEKQWIFICPETLYDEWQIHKKEKERIINDKLKNLKAEFRRQRTINHPFADYTGEELEELRTALFEQFDQIDEIFSQYSIRIAKDDATQEAIRQWKLNDQAPFHRKGRDNQKDAEIMHYAAKAVQKNNIATLFFASDNPQDFAEPKTKPHVLHKDLTELFDGTTVHYHVDAGSLIELLLSAGYTRRPRTGSSERRKIKNIISVDRTQPLLDQVHEYFDKRFTDLVTIPKEIFAEHYPFIKGEVFFYTHKPFTLITDNKELYDLFSTVEIKEGKKIKDPHNFIKNDIDLQKAVSVYRMLSQNLIEKIAYTWEKESVIKWGEPATFCECLLCLCNQLKFEKLFDRLQSAATKLIDAQTQMSEAYAHYQTSDFTTAADILEDMLRNRKEKNDTTQYIINFNLHHLGILIRNHHYDDDVLQKRGRTLIEIDLEEEFRQCRNPQNWALLQWINERKFYRDSLSRMGEELDKIRGYYYGKNAGHNDDMLRLYSHYKSASNFLVQNAIIYDQFDEFSQLTASFTEALFASHGSNNNLGGKQTFFADETVMQLIIRGKAEVIQRFLTRYGLKKLVYKKTNSADSFPEIFTGFLDRYQEVFIQHEKPTVPPSTSFRDRIHEMLYNAMILFSVLDIDRELLNQFGKKIIPIIRTDEHLHPLYIPTYLRVFVTNAASRLDTEVLQQFMELAIEKGVLHEELLFERLKTLIQQKHSSYSMAEAIFKSNIGNFITACDKCNRDHDWNLLSDIFELTDNVTQKDFVTERVTAILQNDFDASNITLLH